MNHLDKLELLKFTFPGSVLLDSNHYPGHEVTDTGLEPFTLSLATLRVNGTSFISVDNKKGVEAAISSAWRHFFGNPQTETLALPDNWEAV